MKKSRILTMILLVSLGGMFGCEKEIRNIKGDTDPPSAEVIPTDINQKGFEFLEKMQGHWVGTNTVINIPYPWFAFDYRPISPSHIHGIYEGGTVGNLLTSFFVTDFKDTRTIMARNGGLLNGIYRSSYFVLDSVLNAPTEDFYRFVDARGGTKIMWMELTFRSDSLYFYAYTSGLGQRESPTRHMTFTADRRNPDLAQDAATAVGFPQNVVAKDFSSGFVTEHLYVNMGNVPLSASFLDQNPTADVYTLAASSLDPFPIYDHPYMAALEVNVVRNPLIDNKRLLLYLSKEPLTDSFGYLDANAFESILLFPEMSNNESKFLLTYLHPGDYYITIVADINEDYQASAGDITHITRAFTVLPEGQQSVTIDQINVQN